MRTLTNSWAAGTIIVVCIAMIYMANTGAFFGKFVSNFFPCTEVETGSGMPCYAKYDVALMIVAAIVGVVFLILFIRSLLPQAQAPMRQ